MIKTIVITGGTDGIGKLAALKLADAGHEVYIHGRDQKKINATITELKKQVNNTKIYGVLADFSDLSSVEKMAEQLKNELPKIDVLINNAGVFKSAHSKNAQGLDLRMVVNFIAPYLLTQHLMPLLKKSATARIVNLSSAAQAPVSIEHLLGHQDIGVQAAYAQSKLALTMWSFELAKQQPSIIVIAVNPGSLLNTKMVQEAYGQHWDSAEKGANILYDLALQDTYSKNSGHYFDNDSGIFSKAHPDAYDAEKIKKLITAVNQIIAR